MKDFPINWFRLNRWAFVVMLVYAFSGCNSATTETHIQRVIPRRIKLPDQITRCDELSKSSYKSIMWISTKECTGCRINTLPLYIDFFEKTRDYLDFCVIISTPYVTTFSQKVDDLCLPFPVFFDGRDRIRRLNRHLPADSEYHFLLLDSNYHTLIVGDPILNPDVEKMYDSLLDCAGR